MSSTTELGKEYCSLSKNNKVSSCSSPKHPPPQLNNGPLPCPRCHSTATKFCYYNNYNLSQPRYFCKVCRRYWTHGGTLRSIPFGGGSHKKYNTTAGSKLHRCSTSTQEEEVVKPDPEREMVKLENPFPVIGEFSTFLMNINNNGGGYGGCDNATWLMNDDVLNNNFAKYHDFHVSE